MAINYSSFSTLQGGVQTTARLTSNGNILEVGGAGGGLQFDGSSSGHVVINASAATTTYSIIWPAAQAASSGYTLSNDGTGVLTWVPLSTGSVTGVSVNTSNGFAGTSSGGATPALTLSTTVTGIIYGNGTALSAAVAGNFPTLNQNTTGTAANVTATSNSTITTLTALSLPTSQLSGSISLTSQVSGTLPYANGGTNATTQAQAQANMSPMTTAGDLTYENSTPAPARLPIGSNGQILTVVSGLPAWAAAPATGANTSLSNLTTTSINQSLIPASTSGAQVLGSSANYWGVSFISKLSDLTPTTSVDIFNRQLINTNATVSVDWNNNELFDSSDVGALNWQNRQAIDSAGVAAIAWSARTLLSKSGFSTYTSVDWQNRNLVDTSAVTQLNWSTSGVAFSQLTPSTVPYLNSSSVLTASAVTPTQLGYLSGASGTTGTGNLVLSASPTFTGTVTAGAASFSSAVNMNSNKITNLATPTASSDAATKGYVDAAISGLYWEGPAKAYAASNVPLTGGATLTIDGYSVQNGDLVILGNQTTASQNGEYQVSGIGTAYTLTSNSLPSAAGQAWLILNGTVYKDSAFVANAAIPSATFTEFAGPTAYTFSAPLSLSGNTVSITQATTSTNGYLSSTDWNTFNGKQPAGNYITALTGDATASGPGSAPLTLATVNSSPGSSGSSTAIPTVTVNAKGLVTSVTTNPVVAPAGTLTGTTLASNVVNSSLTSVGTLTGTTNATNLALTGTLVAPTLQISAVYGGAATLTANTTYAVRWGIPANSETAGKLYLADWNTASFNLYWVVGLYNSTSSTSTGATITVTSKGLFTLGSADSTFGTSDQGKPVWLGSAGAFTPSSTFSPASGYANEKIGIAQTSSVIYVDCQLMGIS